MQYDYKIIEQKFKQMPEEIQTALSSADITVAIQEISARHGLKLDQEEVLYDLTAYVMLGLTPSKEFVANFSKETGVDEKTSKKIADDINREIFSTIKTSMRAFEEKAEEEAPPSPIGASNRNFGSEQRFGGTTGSANGGVLRDMSVNTPIRPSANASLERAGNFSIEPEMPVAPRAGAPMAGAATTRNMSGIGKWGTVAPEATTADHAETLHAIENPTLNMERGAKEQFARQKAAEKADEEHYEPLVDQLLNSPAAIPLEKITVKVPMDIPAAAKKEPVKPSAPKPPVNLPTGDPYREAVK